MHSKEARAAPGHVRQGCSCQLTHYISAYSGCRADFKVLQTERCRDLLRTHSSCRRRRSRMCVAVSNLEATVCPCS